MLLKQCFIMMIFILTHTAGSTHVHRDCKNDRDFIENVYRKWYTLEEVTSDDMVKLTDIVECYYAKSGPRGPANLSTAGEMVSIYDNQFIEKMWRNTHEGNKNSLAKLRSEDIREIEKIVERYFCLKYMENPEELWEAKYMLKRIDGNVIQSAWNTLYVWCEARGDYTRKSGTTLTQNTLLQLLKILDRYNRYEDLKEPGNLSDAKKILRQQSMRDDEWIRETMQKHNVYEALSSADREMMKQIHERVELVKGMYFRYNHKRDPYLPKEFKNLMNHYLYEDGDDSETAARRLERIREVRGHSTAKEDFLRYVTRGKVSSRAVGSHEQKDNNSDESEQKDNDSDEKIFKFNAAQRQTCIDALSQGHGDFWSPTREASLIDNPSCSYQTDAGEKQGWLRWMTDGFGKVFGMSRKQPRGRVE